MRPAARRQRVAVALAVAMLSFAACDSATDPLVDRVDAELLFLSVRESAIRSTHGFAAFESALPLAERALRQGEAVLVRLSSSRGDAETLRLVAPTPVTIEGAPATRLPREYILGPAAGVDFDELLRDVEALGVRHILVGEPVASFARSYVAANNEAAAVAAVRALPGVQFFEPNSIGCLAACEPVEGHPVFGAILLDAQPSVMADDGVLSVAAGDTLRIVYRSANGSTSTFSTVVQ